MGQIRFSNSLGWYKISQQIHGIEIGRLFCIDVIIRDTQNKIGGSSISNMFVRGRDDIRMLRRIHPSVTDHMYIQNIRMSLIGLYVISFRLCIDHRILDFNLEMTLMDIVVGK